MIKFLSIKHSLNKFIIYAEKKKEVKNNNRNTRFLLQIKKYEREILQR